MSNYSVFDPLNDELGAHAEAILATFAQFHPTVRMRIADIFVQALLEDVRLSVEENATSEDRQ